MLFCRDKSILKAKANLSRLKLRLRIRVYMQGKSILQISQETKIYFSEDEKGKVDGWKSVAGIPLLLSKAERDNYKHNLAVGERLLLMAFDQGFKTEVIEGRNFHGAISDAIRITTPEGYNPVFFFDRKSGLVSAIEQTQFNVERGANEVTAEYCLDWKNGKNHPISYRQETFVDGKPFSAVQWKVVKDSFVAHTSLFKKPELKSAATKPFVTPVTIPAKQNQDRLLLFCSVGKNPLVTSYFLLDTGAGLSVMNTNAISNFNAWYDGKGENSRWWEHDDPRDRRFNRRRAD